MDTTQFNMNNNMNMMNMNNNMMNMNMNNMMNMNNNMNNINNQIMMQNFFRDFYTKTMAVYQMFNRINQMNNSNNRIKIVQGGSMTNSKKLGRLPRGKETVDYDPFIGYNGPKLNLMFETPSGHKTNIVCPLNVKVYDILRQYTAKVGLGPNVIGNGIYFLYNGRRLGKSFYDSQVDQVFTHGEKVVVIDYGNLIGFSIQMPLIHEPRSYVIKVAIVIFYYIFCNVAIFNKDDFNTDIVTRINVNIIFVMNLIADFFILFQDYFDFNLKIPGMESMKQIAIIYPFMLLMGFSCLNSMFVQVIFLLLFT